MQARPERQETLWQLRVEKSCSLIASLQEGYSSSSGNKAFTAHDHQHDCSPMLCSASVAGNCRLPGPPWQNQQYLLPSLAGDGPFITFSFVFISVHFLYKKNETCVATVSEIIPFHDG